MLDGFPTDGILFGESEDKMKKYILPIGTIVLLQNATKKMMIIGVKQIIKEKLNKTYDYIGVPYPEGFLGNTFTWLFNAEDINDVLFKGYESKEYEAFSDMIESLYEKNDTKTNNKNNE